MLGQNYLLTKTGAQVPAFDPPNLANQNQRGGDRRSTDYHLTLETAKHIGMMERNDKGHEVRRYFIECERRLLEGAQAQIPDALPQEIQDAIDHKAHLLSVQSFERIRAALAELAREHLREGEPVAKVIKRLEQGTPQIGDMHLIQADDLWPLTSTMANLAFALSIVMEAPMDALHRLEARTGRRWYNRQG